MKKQVELLKSAKENLRTKKSLFVGQYTCHLHAEFDEFNAFLHHLYVLLFTFFSPLKYQKIKNNSTLTFKEGSWFKYLVTALVVFDSSNQQNL